MHTLQVHAYFYHRKDGLVLIFKRKNTEENKLACLTSLISHSDCPIDDYPESQIDNQNNQAGDIYSLADKVNIVILMF